MILLSSCLRRYCKKINAKLLEPDFDFIDRIYTSPVCFKGNAIDKQVLKQKKAWMKLREDQEFLKRFSYGNCPSNVFVNSIKIVTSVFSAAFDVAKLSAKGIDILRKNLPQGPFL